MQRIGRLIAHLQQDRLDLPQLELLLPVSTHAHEKSVDFIEGHEDIGDGPPYESHGLIAIVMGTTFGCVQNVCNQEDPSGVVWGIVHVGQFEYKAGSTDERRMIYKCIYIFGLVQEQPI